MSRQLVMRTAASSWPFCVQEGMVCLSTVGADDGRGDIRQRAVTEPSGQFWGDIL